MEAGLDADAFIQMFAASMAANMMIVAAVAGFALLFKEDREARAQGRKFNAPGYAYALALVPIALAIFAGYAVS